MHVRVHASLTNAYRYFGPSFALLASCLRTAI